jgi:hypothetical protein
VQLHRAKLKKKGPSPDGPSQPKLTNVSKRTRTHVNVFQKLCHLAWLDLFLPLGAKKFGHQVAADFGLNARGNLRFGVELTAHGAEAALFVAGPVDDAANLGPKKSSSTHGTGFERDVERAVGEVFGTQVVGGRRDGLHFGVGRDVVELLREVVATRDDLVVAHHNSPHRHFVRLVGFESFADGLAHEIHVVKLHGDKTT